MSAFGPLVSTNWLAEHLGDVKIIDASWRMPGEASARADYEQRHIPHAVYFDIDAIADKSVDLPHMLPSPNLFERAVGELGVADNDVVVVYDDKGCFSAPRVWWTFRAMGHAKVAVLDGGLPKWLAEERAVTSAAPKPSPVTYQAAFRQSDVCNAEDVRARLYKADTVILDARSQERFRGEAAEPRIGLRAGAMPGASNLPFGNLIKPDGTFCAPDAISEHLANAGVEQDKEIITTCGSGITAAVISLALEITGHPNHKLYDGSWAEWGDERLSDKEFPVIACT